MKIQDQNESWKALSNATVTDIRWAVDQIRNGLEKRRKERGDAIYSGNHEALGDVLLRFEEMKKANSIESLRSSALDLAVCATWIVVSTRDR